MEAGGPRGLGFKRLLIKPAVCVCVCLVKVGPAQQARQSHSSFVFLHIVCRVLKYQEDNLFKHPHTQRDTHTNTQSHTHSSAFFTVFLYTEQKQFIPKRGGNRKCLLLAADLGQTDGS